MNERPDTTPIVAGKNMDGLLCNLLKIATPYGHEKLLHKFFPKNKIIDEKGNVIVKVGKDYTTMFSSHMDTVHRNPGDVFLELTEDGYVFGSELNDDNKYVPSILGADDKLGVWIMLKMIKHGTPGLYVFHVGEERGGIGSRYISDRTPELVKGMQRCVAFDRMDYTDVITRQQGGVCCSKEFAKELAKRINVKIPNFKQFEPSSHGVFTDSANYRRLIPECTNLSVGYFNQHTRVENFDYIWLEQIFLPAILDLEWETLPIKRDPKVITASTSYNYSRNANRVLKKIDWDKITYNMDYSKIPYWDKNIVIDKDTPAWKLAILLKKYGFENSSSSTYQAIAEYICDLYKEATEKITGLTNQVEQLKEELEEKTNELETIDVFLNSDGTSVSDILSEKEELEHKLAEVEDAIEMVNGILWEQGEEDDSDK